MKAIRIFCFVQIDDRQTLFLLYINRNSDDLCYFMSFEALKTACPELAKKIDTTTTRKYYVDVTIPDNIETEHNFYNTYYYIEKK